MNDRRMGNPRAMPITGQGTSEIYQLTPSRVAVEHDRKLKAAIKTVLEKKDYWDCDMVNKVYEAELMCAIEDLRQAYESK